MMDSFFENSDIGDFPVTWQEFNAQGKKVFIMASTVNSALEAEADRLLGQDADGQLLPGEVDEEDAKKAVVTMLGLDDED